MNWCRNYYRSTYNEKFFFSEQEIDFTTEYLNYHQFLLQEFFNADLTSRKKISEYYYNEYGERSFAYLKRKYSEWANGDYHLTDLMKGRIISFMPQFLTEEAKHKLGIHDFMSSIKRTVNTFWKNNNYEHQRSYSQKKKRLWNIGEVLNLFENDNERINNLTFNRYRFNILNEEERKEALEISKYILKVKLQNVFNQVKKDFDTFLPFMNKFNRGSFSASYDISFYDCHIDLAESNGHEISFPIFHIKEIESNSQFRKYSDKYLAYEMVSVHIDNKTAIVKSFLNNNDISIFYNHYEELSKGDSAVNMNGIFQGEGGVLNLRVEMKPLKILRISISKSIFKLIVFIIIISGLVSWTINKELYSLLLWGGIIGGLISLSYISEEFSDLRKLIKEHRKYGK